MNYPPLQNLNNCEHIKTRILQLHNRIIQDDFKNSHIIKELANDFNSIISIVQYSICKNASYASLDIIKQAEFISLLENLFCFVSYVRDIHMGLGIRTLSYSFISILYTYFPDFTELFIMHLLQDEHCTRSIGSWRDAIGICDYVYKTQKDHSIINFFIKTINQTLFNDLQQLNKTGRCKTNISKWIPRENSSKKWLFYLLSIQWCETHHSYLLKHCININSNIRAKKKCYMIYRKMVSRLSRSLNITERIISNKNQFRVQFHNIPVNSLFKNWFLLFNTTKDMKTLYQNSKLHLLTADSLSKQIKTNKLPVYRSTPFYVNYYHFPQGIDRIVSFMFQCIQLVCDYQKQHKLDDFIFTLTHYEKIYDNISLLNCLWDKIYDKWSRIADVDKQSIAVINIQVTSLQDPIFYKAVSRACFIAQSSNINRILFCAHVPIWINLQNCGSLYSKISHIYRSLENEIIINTSLENNLKILGFKHPFTPIVINNNGFCFNYHYEVSFKDCFDIFNNPRYKKIQNSFQDNIELINKHFSIDL